MDSLLVNYEEKIIDIGQKINAALKPYENDDEIRTHAERIRKIYQEELKDVRPKLMVYGIYNAGKSSIINELLGADKAKVEDTPTTDTVSGYEWNGYKLYDTPGVGAPIEHEKVTNEHLQQADIVMFVMSTTGSSERAENYTRMKDIADTGKKIIIVLNDKNGDLGTRDEEIQKIKLQVSEHMKQVGISDVEKRYCIIVVNAKRAKTGRCTGKQRLWEMSNMDELGRVILNELKKTTSFQVMRRLVSQMQQELQSVLDSVQGEKLQGELQHLTGILRELQKYRTKMRDAMQAKIERKCEAYGNKLTAQIWQNRENEEMCGRIVKEEHQKLVDRLQKVLKDELAEMTESLREDLEKVINVNEIQQGRLEANEIKGEQLKPGKIQTIPNIEAMMPNSPDISMEEIIDNVMDGIAKGDIINAGIKKVIDNVMKTSVGSMVSKTVVGKAIGTFIPYIGQILIGLSFLSSLLKGSSKEEEARWARAQAENEAARKRAEAEAQAQQELQQKCKYAAEEMAEDLVVAVNEMLRDVFRKMEEPIRQRIQNDQAAAAQRLNWEMECQELIMNCENLRISLGESAADGK